MHEDRNSQQHQQSVNNYPETFRGHRSIVQNYARMPVQTPPPLNGKIQSWLQFRVQYSTIISTGFKFTHCANFDVVFLILGILLPQ